MKKVLACILLLLMVGDSLGLNQLAKLPVLFQHLAEHQSADENISLMDFLIMHYWGSDMDDDDDDRDMQLPFKKADAQTSVVLFLPAVKISSCKLNSRPVEKQYAVYRNRHYPNPSLSSPFRPPCA